MDELTKLAIKDISEAAKENALIVFVGAGVSKNSGLPSWSELIKIFKDELHLDAKENDYEKIAQYYYDSLGQHKYFQEVNKVFQSHQNARPNKIHDEIFRIKPKHIITTNYDHLIEDKMNTSVVKYEVIQQDSDIPYAKTDHYLIKMHGDLLQKNIVLKEDDFLDYDENFYMISTLIKSVIMNSTVLFVGYSLNDSTFNSIFRLIQKGFGGNARKAYFYSPKSQSAAAVEYYKNKGIRIIMPEGEDNQADIGEKTVAFLKEIKQEQSKIPKDPETLWKNLQFLDQLPFVETKTVIHYSKLSAAGSFSHYTDFQWEKDYLKAFSLGESFSLKEFLKKKTWFTTFLDYQKTTQTNLGTDEVLQRAYQLYLKGDYPNSKAAFRQIANDSFLKKDYWNYFVAEFNICHLNHQLQGYQSFSETSENFSDLNEILESFILNGDEITKELSLFFKKEILSFHFVYDRLYQFNKILDEIRQVNYPKEKLIKNIQQLQQNFQSFLYFLQCNAITVQQYHEFKTLLLRYLECLLIAYKQLKIPLLLTDIQPLFSYLKEPEMAALMKTYHLEEITIEKNAETNLLNRIITSLKQEKTSQQVKITKDLANTIGFLSFIKLTSLEPLLALLKEIPIYPENRGILVHLLQLFVKNSQNLAKKEPATLFNIIKTQLEVMIKYNNLQEFTVTLSYYQQLMAAIYKENPTMEFSSNILAEKLLLMIHQGHKLENFPQYHHFIKTFSPYFSKELQALILRLNSKEKTV